jgi:hypothetical protein
MIRNSSLPDTLVPAWAKTHWFSLSLWSWLFVLLFSCQMGSFHVLHAWFSMILLQDNILAIFHGNGGSAVFVAFDAVEVRSDPIRHVGGVGVGVRGKG